jgi:NAD(P)H-dependent FMN reductase
MKILGIAGSMNADSTTKKATDIVARAAGTEGAQVNVIHLADLTLPVFRPDQAPEDYTQNAAYFIEQVREAKGLILASPEYHGSISGCLKNALDYISGRDLEDKIVATLGTSGGGMGATKTVEVLGQICRTLHAWPLPLTPSVSRSYDAFREDGQLKDEKLQGRLEALGRRLVQELRLRNSQT